MSSTPTPLIGQLHAVHVLGGNSGAHVASLARGLVARGVRVTVCGTPGAAREFGFEAAGARFVTVAPRQDAAAALALRGVCAGADVVHAHGLRAGLLASLALSALPGRRARRTPLVVTRHSAVVADGQRARMLRLLERRVSRTATVVLGTTTDLVDRARSLGARDARLAPAALPVPLPGQRTAGGPDGLREGTARDRARAELGVRGRPLLVSAGRLEEHKGYDTLLDAARVWRDARPAPLALIAGDGSRRAALARRIEAERLPVRLLGPGAEALLLAAGDLAVLPSRWEGRSRLAQQALRTGLPLVATAVGGVPELVGEAAALVPYGDPLALAAEVTGLLADADRRAALALAGRAQAAGWPTEDDTVAQVLSVYDELTAAAP